MSKFIDLDIEYEKNSIPLRKLIPKGMTIKEYFGKEQRLLRGENISYINFEEQKKGANKKAPEKAKITNRLSINRFKNQTKGQK